MANCAVCGKSIGFFSASFLGNEGLADGGKICGACIKRVAAVNAAIASNIHRYTTSQINTTLQSSVPNGNAVMQQLQKIGVNTSDSFAKTELSLLPKYIQDGETILGLVKGYSNLNSAIMVATDKRVFTLDNRDILEQVIVKSLNYDNVTNVDYGIVLDKFAYVKVFTSGEDIAIGDLNIEEGKKFADIVNRQREKSKQITVNVTQATDGADAASQLEKFASLLQQGLLTKEEFDAQKKKLLGL